jgi:Uri superfamily endonuclease
MTISADAHVMRRTASAQLRQSVVFEPPLDEWPAAGVYQLWIRVLRELRLTVGRVGRFRMPAGMYVYTGRAARGLQARVLRHVRGSDRRHWHVDYLLASKSTRLERVILASADPEHECDVSRSLASYGTCIIPRFGASDCSRRCPTHLWLIDA